MSEKVQCYRQSLSLNVYDWTPDSSLPNLRRDGFAGTYPYNLKDNFSSAARLRHFEALVVENAYVRATVVPEMGVRLFSLYDKVNNAEVFNMPDAIRPAPIMLRGAYLAVGMEFNFPCGHSVHAAERVPCDFVELPEEHGAGIKMLVYNAVSGLKTDILFYLRPDERLLHTRLMFSNPLPVRNGFMYWCNPAVEQTPEMTFQCKAPMSHFFTSYNSFPIIDGEDYRIAKNRGFASDAFAIGSPEDWYGFYSPEFGRGAVHLSPVEQMRGKKFFSWGFDDYAFRWGRHFHCGDYGYMEFQAGILETQFEYLHLEPYEHRCVEETWFPYHDLGDVSHAVESLIFSHEPARLCFTAAKPYSAVAVTVDGHVSEFDAVEPGGLYDVKVEGGFDPDNYHLRVTAGSELLIDKQVTTPSPASSEAIAEKQAWLDLEPRDPGSILELAMRAYKGRLFNRSRELAAKLLQSDYAEQGQALLAEIDYWQSRDTQDSKFPNELEKLYSQPKAEILQTRDEDTFQYQCDYYTIVAEADRHAQRDDYQRAFDIVEGWSEQQGQVPALVFYLLAYLQMRLDSDQDRISQLLWQAELAGFDSLNPHTELEELCLAWLTTEHAKLAHPWYWRGCYWALRDQSRACTYWRRAFSLDSDCFAAARNLGYTALRGRDKLVEALAWYEKAIQACGDEPTLIVEYLSALRLNGKIEKGYHFIQSLPKQLRRDYRLVKASAEFLRDVHQFDAAIELLVHGADLYIWEGETCHHRCYLECLTALGREALRQGESQKAWHYFMRMDEYPESLLRGKLRTENRASFYYHLGQVMQAQGDQQQAHSYYRQAVEQDYPHSHHWVSYRENEYFGALAARKIGDKQTERFIIDRLTTLYAGDSYSPENIELAPNQCLYYSHLAAARGFMLTGQWDKSLQSVVNGEKAFGYCFAFEDAREELARWQKKGNVDLA